MLRAIFRRRFKDNISGIQIDNQLYSLDFHHKGIEKELRSGGFGEHGYEIRELVGIEVSEDPVKDEDEPAPVRDYKDRHDKPTQCATQQEHRRHAYVDTPLKGKDVKVQLATLLDGPFVNQTACVYVEFADGLCIAEISIGTTNVLGVVDRTQMRFWEEAVEVRADGSVVFANDKEQKKAPQPDYSARADVPYTPDLNPPKQAVSEKAHAGGEHPWNSPSLGKQLLAVIERYEKLRAP